MGGVVASEQRGAAIQVGNPVCETNGDASRSQCQPSAQPAVRRSALVRRALSPKRGVNRICTRVISRAVFTSKHAVVLFSYSKWSLTLPCHWSTNHRESWSRGTAYALISIPGVQIGAPLAHRAERGRLRSAPARRAALVGVRWCIVGNAVFSRSCWPTLARPV